jgi:hypothetical protein
MCCVLSGLDALRVAADTALMPRCERNACAAFALALLLLLLTTCMVAQAANERVGCMQYVADLTRAMQAALGGHQRIN